MYSSQKPQASLSLTYKFNFNRRSGLKAKWQLNGLSKTLPVKNSVVNRVVRLQEIYETPDLTSTLAQPITLALTSHLVEGDISACGTALPAPTLCPGSPALASPHPVIPTLALTFPSPSALAPKHLTSNLPNSVKLGQGIKEDLHYAKMAQAPYPPL